MKRIYSPSTAITKFIWLLCMLLILGGCSGSKMCCSNHQSKADKQAYCTHHRDALLKYVNAAENATQKHERLSRFKGFYDQVKRCKSVYCIDTTILSNTSMQEFKPLYVLEHELAEQGVRLSPKDKTSLILCGFREAMNTLERSEEGKVFSGSPDVPK